MRSSRVVTARIVPETPQDAKYGTSPTSHPAILTNPGNRFDNRLGATYFQNFYAVCPSNMCTHQQYSFDTVGQASEVR